MAARLINDEIILVSSSDHCHSIIGQTKKQRQWRHNQKKRQMEKQLSVLTPFKYHSSPKVFFINRLTSIFALFKLIEYAKKIKYFSIDTEHGYHSHRPALIQVHFIEETSENVVVLFEMAQLPTSSSQFYQHFRLLINAIFNPSNTLYMWGDGYDELRRFQMYDLFNLVPVENLNCIDVQLKFKYWYNINNPHDKDCSMSFNIDDHPACGCTHRPYKNVNERWRLQLAIAYIFNEYLNKTKTCNDWDIGLDSRLHQKIHINEDKQRMALVDYAVNDCFALTKLINEMIDFL